MYLSGVQKELSGFPLKTCGNDNRGKERDFEMTSKQTECWKVNTTPGDVRGIFPVINLSQFLEKSKMPVLC